MATISFHLKEPKLDKPSAIFIWFNPQNGQPRIRLYTSDKIHPDQWTGGVVQRALTKGRNIDPDIKRANEALNANNERMSTRLLIYWNECRAIGVLPSAEALRQVIEPEAAPQAVLPRPPLLTDLLAFKERRAQVLHPNTIKAYKTLHDTLKHYESVTGWPLRHTDLTLNFWHEFTAYLLSLPVKGRIGLEDN